MADNNNVNNVDTGQIGTDIKPTKKTHGKSDIATYNNSLTSAQRVASAKKAAAASAAARRQKGFVREMLNGRLTDPKLQAILDAVIAKAAKGDVMAYDAILKTLGENVATEINLDIGENAQKAVKSMTMQEKLKLIEEVKK